jgi:16S rRNA processing protein RimM
VKQDNLIAVGKLRKPHGTGGAFAFELTANPLDENLMPTHFFLESTSGEMLPFFLKSHRYTEGRKGILEFEEIDNREKAAQLSGVLLHLREAEAKKFFEEETTDDVAALIGYTVVDAESGDKLGIITNIVGSEMQAVAVVEGNAQELLIPLADDLIADVNRKKKTISMILPEGLKELYS